MINTDSNENLPEGYELISGSVCGNTDPHIAEPYFFAVKRSVAAPSAYLQGYPIIDDICFIWESEGEEAPEEYVVLDKCLIKKSTSSHRIFVSYHVRKPVGLCNLKYKATTVDRYPKKVRMHIGSNYA